MTALSFTFMVPFPFGSTPSELWSLSTLFPSGTTRSRGRGRGGRGGRGRDGAGAAMEITSTGGFGRQSNHMETDQPVRGQKRRGQQSTPRGGGGEGGGEDLMEVEGGFNRRPRGGKGKATALFGNTSPSTPAASLFGGAPSCD